MTFETGSKNQDNSDGQKDSPRPLSLQDFGLVQLHRVGQLSAPAETPTEAFCDGLADGAYRQPLRAIQQLAGAKSDASSSAPRNITDGNAQSHQLGQILGSLVPFAALGMATRGASNRLFGAEVSPTLLRTVGEQAATGFLLGSVLTPSELKANESLLGARLHQGGVSALTFAAMSGSAHMLNRALPEFGAGTIPLVSRRFTIAALSGATGGVVDAEARSGFTASGKEVMSSAVGYAAFGVAMEGGGMLAKAMLKNEAGVPPARKEAPLKQEASAKQELTSDRSEHKSSRMNQNDESLPNGIAQIEDLPRELKGYNELLDDLLGKGWKELEAQKLDRIQRVFSAVENAERTEPKVEKPVAHSEPGWEPDPRLKLVPKADLPYAREVLLNELKSFEGGGEAHRFQLFKELMNTTWLSDAQKIRLTDVVCNVRDFYAHMNTGENPLAFKAQRSWALSQASLAEVINEALVNAEKGIKPDAAALEEQILVKLFTQFRIHENSPTEALPAQMHADRVAGAKTILRSIGYPKDQILRISETLQKEPLWAQSLDLVKYDQDLLKKFEPNYKEGLARRDPLLASETPIRENWKIPVGEETLTADGTRITKWTDSSGGGELRRTADGRSVVLDQKSDRMFAYSSEGNITQASHVDNRKFFYTGTGELNRIESTDLGNLYRSTKGSWYKDLGVDHGGAPSVEPFWKGKLIADDNGGIRLIKPGGSEVRLFGIDGSLTWHPENGRAEIKAANFKFEQGVLQDRIQNAFPEAARQQRMGELLSSFENRVDARGLGDNTKALFYRQLNRLLADRADLTLPLDARRNLAEQATNHAAFPSTIDQGANKTCNVTTIENRIYTRSPQDIARILADLSETGEYTTHGGATIDIKNSLTGFKPDAEAREALRLQGEAGPDVKVDGHRDWASQLAQTVMVKIKHLQTTDFIAKDTVVDGVELVFNQNANLIGKVLETEIATLLDSSGNRIKTLNPGEQAYVKIGDKLEKVSSESFVYDRHGELSGSVSDASKITPLYDYFGKQFEKLVPGSNYFDKDGNLVMYQTVPGDITFDKLTSDKPPSVPFNPSDDASRLHVRHLGLDIFLKQDVQGKSAFIDSPLLNTSFYRDIANEVTGAETAPFSIARGTEYKTFHSSIRVTNEAEFAQAIEKLQNDGNLPGILRVHTQNWPFNHKRGGWHVINLQAYDAEKRLIQFTNQWGSKNDYMGDKAVPLEKMFTAMMEPPPPPVEAPVPQGPPSPVEPKPPLPLDPPVPPTPKDLPAPYDPSKIPEF